MNQRPLVLYHAACQDGWTAAWCAWRKFGASADYIAVSYNQSPPDVSGRNVFVLDFCYPRPILTSMRLAATSLVILDHHVSAERDTAGFVEECRLNNFPAHVVFDMGHSGAWLAWKHFFPDAPVPLLVLYAEDRDLWKWELPQSREINASLASRTHTFDEWEYLYQHMQRGNSGSRVGFDELRMEGVAILRYQQQQVDLACASASEVEIDGYKILAVNAVALQSEIAGHLAEGRPFGACFFIRHDGMVIWSLRSRKDGVDVSEIAKRHGGGGHRNAAGFEVSLSDGLSHFMD